VKGGKMENPNVLSFDPDKVSFVETSCGLVVEKRTNVKEYDRIVDARYFLDKNHIVLRDDDFLVMTAPVLEWRHDESVLVTLFCGGINGEVALRNASGNQRTQLIDIFKELFLKIRLTGFLWGDCAPRNIIFNKEAKRIWIVDFERDVHFRTGPVLPAEFSRYIRNYSAEEFACFLFEDEQKYLFTGVLTGEPLRDIATSAIGSKRKRKVLSLMFGERDAYNTVEMRAAEQAMISAATPFVCDGAPIYPMDIIDRISNKGGPDAYGEIIQRAEKIQCPADRIKELESLEKYFR